MKTCHLVALSIIALAACTTAETTNASSLTSDYAAGEYMGCWSDDAARALPYFAGEDATMEPLVCRNRCTAAGYPYAGVQYSTQCFCGDSIGREQRPEEECETACYGNPYLACGGPWRNSIYYAPVAPPPVVRLYRDVNWQGDYLELRTNTPFVGYDWNDQISSVYFPQPGLAITLHEHAGYEGGRIYIAGSIPDLSIFSAIGTDWSDRASSVEVHRR